MTKLVLCFDGTWNKAADDGLPDDDQVETNVRRFYESTCSNGKDRPGQLAWYDEGVGTKWWDKFAGGAMGAGLDVHLMAGYEFLVSHYKPGDEIYILGFSRGAYTARSLVGMLRNVWLVQSGPFAQFRSAAAYGIYRTRGDTVDSFAAKSFRRTFAREVQVKFLGVWDTVGALGIPLSAMQQFNSEFYEFHDTELSNIVEHAYHAIALDEHRVDYDICLWNPRTKPNQTIEQRWFCGAHADIGGGYPTRFVSDAALGWMQDKAKALGLELDRVQPKPANGLPKITDSYSEFLGGTYAKLKPRHYRRVLQTAYGQECLDASVNDRRLNANPKYVPSNFGLPAL